MDANRESKLEWIRSLAPIAYSEAMAIMEARVDDIIAGRKPELIWLLEHPPLYTAGSSAQATDLKDDPRFPVFETGRGGQYTYHGPGQRVIYAMLDLRQRGKDLRRHVWNLEEWMIRALAEFGVRGERREGRVGIWVAPGAVAVAGSEHRERTAEQSRLKNNTTMAVAGSPQDVAQSSRAQHAKNEEKIGAIGVRVRKWVAYHGLALNVDPDLSHFDGIVPCGLPQFGVTSLRKLGLSASMVEIDAAFQKNLPIFNAPTVV